MNPLDIYLRGYLKPVVYAGLVENEEALHHRIVDACETIRNFERTRRFMMRRVKGYTESHAGHSEHLLQTHSFSYNSQMKKIYSLAPYYVNNISIFYSVTTTGNIDTP
jgi:hypothetical protein